MYSNVTLGKHDLDTISMLYLPGGEATFYGRGHMSSGHTGIGHTGIGHIGIGHIDSDHTDSGHTGIGHTGIGHTGIGHIGIGHTSSGHTTTLRVLMCDVNHTFSLYIYISFNENFKLTNNTFETRYTFVNS